MSREAPPALRISAGGPSGRWQALVLIAVVVILTAVVGGAASINAQAFYTQLAKPAWAPPPGVFGPVWTLLYALMGIAAFRVWRARGSFRAARLPLSLFFAQLVVNGLWSWLFFGWRLGFAALLDVALLWLLVVATLVSFWQVQRLAGWLLVPYLLWTAFATALTAAVWHLNPALL